MAGFMESVNRGLTIVNAKTSNLVETTKLKSVISTKENEISALMKNIGEFLYVHRNEFTIDMVKEQIDEIEKKYTDIDNIKKQISEIEENEKKLISSPAPSTTSKAMVFCTQCGSQNPAESNFCEKCGAKLVKL